MSRTITALFDTRADAEAGGERVKQAGADAAHIHVHDKTSHKTSGEYSTHEDKGMWASIKHVFLPDEDRHTYEEGVRRGGYVLTADIDDDKAPAAVRALEDSRSIDLNERSTQWRSEGWKQPDSAGRVPSSNNSLVGVRELGEGSERVRSYVRPSDRG